MSPTTEEQEALALRRWLEHPSWPPPEDVDVDVAEAVYALRPDLAPGPTATIEEILATVSQAGDVEKLLAGEDIELDADVAEAIYALRPDKAPGPKIRIESILERVTEGPLAAGAPANAPVDVGGEVVPFPGRPAHVTEVQPANEPLGRTMQTMARTRAEERARSRWFPLVASGSALLVAALAAIVITPRILGGGAQDAAPTEQVAAAPMAAPATGAPADRFASDEAAPARADAPVAPEGAAAATPSSPPPAAIPEVVAQLDKQEAQQPFTEVGGLDGYKGGEGSGASGARFRDDSVAAAPAKDAAPAAPKAAATARPPTVDAKVPADADGDVVADLGDDEEKPADEYWSNLQGATGGAGAPVGGAFGGTVATGSAPPPTAQAARPSAGDEVADDDDMTRGADAPLELARESKKDEKEKASKPREPRRGAAGPAASNELQPTFDQVAAAEAPPPPPPAEPAVVADASAHATSNGTMTTGTVTTETATTSSTATAAGRGEAKTKSAPSSRASAWAIPVSAPSLDALSADARDRATSLDAQASALAAQGRYHDAATTLTPAISAPAAVGEWYAARVAQYYLSAGETTAALDACRLGLSLGTPQTALLRVYGDVLAATGDTAGAERAYQQAISARGASGRTYAPTASPRSTTSEAR